MLIKDKIALKLFSFYLFLRVRVINRFLICGFIGHTRYLISTIKLRTDDGVYIDEEYRHCAVCAQTLDEDKVKA